MENYSSHPMPNIESISLNNGDLILASSISRAHTLKKESHRLNSFAFILCTKSEAKVIINEKEITLRAGDLLLGTPSLVATPIGSNEDFSCHCIALSLDYAKRILLHMRQVWNLKYIIEKSPIIHINEEAFACFLQYYDLLLEKAKKQQTDEYQEVISSLLMAFLYEFGIFMKSITDNITVGYSAGENIFHRFMEILTTSMPKERMVMDYAEQLCITPKYLSSICKQQSGHTASELIDAYVLKDIEYQLKYTKKSIKEISNELKFPNISFFGKYVKKHLGCSPKEVRERFIQQ